MALLLTCPFRAALMNCVREGQFAVMGDSNNLNGNGGTYRLHLEAKTPR